MPVWWANTLRLHTSCLAPSHHVLLRQEKGGSEGRGVEGKYIPWGVVGAEFLRPDVLPVTNQSSANDIHWNSSFLQPLTDSLLSTGSPVSASAHTNDTQWENTTKKLQLQRRNCLGSGSRATAADRHSTALQWFQHTNHLLTYRPRSKLLA